jgi:uncharacterized repeat protein (TIGR03803 family)
MADSVRRRGWISRMGVQAASAALTLVIVLELVLVAALPAQAQTFTVLYTFTGGTDGDGPQAPVIFDRAGNLYSTSGLGGDPTCGNSGVGCGTVFKLDKTGKETVLHMFGGSDGQSPIAGLVRDSLGNLYGTTSGRR